MHKTTHELVYLLLLILHLDEIFSCYMFPMYENDEVDRNLMSTKANLSVCFQLECMLFI